MKKKHIVQIVDLVFVISGCTTLAIAFEDWSVGAGVFLIAWAMYGCGDRF